jgi:hypothetical protein
MWCASEPTNGGDQRLATLASPLGPISPRVRCIAWLGMGNRTAAKELNDCIHKKPWGKPNERNGPTKKQRENMACTAILRLVQHRAD